MVNLLIFLRLKNEKEWEHVKKNLLFTSLKCRIYILFEGDYNLDDNDYNVYINDNEDLQDLYRKSNINRIKSHWRDYGIKEKREFYLVRDTNLSVQITNINNIFLLIINEVQKNDYDYVLSLKFTNNFIDKFEDFEKKFCQIRENIGNYNMYFNAEDLEYSGIYGNIKLFDKIILNLSLSNINFNDFIHLKKNIIDWNLYKKNYNIPIECNTKKKIILYWMFTGKKKNHKVVINDKENVPFTINEDIFICKSSIFNIFKVLNYYKILSNITNDSLENNIDIAKYDYTDNQIYIFRIIVYYILYLSGCRYKLN